jgi:nucleoside 2-deoxyribosyltransferase
MNFSTLEFVVFFFALLRFMFGAWRFHEETRDDPSNPMALWNMTMMVIVFLTFYAAGMTIKSSPLMFYKMFALAHGVDFIWFSVFTLFAPTTSLLGKAAKNFLYLDALTIGWSLLSVVFLSGFPSFGWGAGLGMLAIGTLDLRMNQELYFVRHGQASPAVAYLPPTTKRQVYFAGPLFTHAEWQRNAALADGLRKAGFSVTVPQEGAAPMLSGTKTFDAAALFSANVKAIEQASCVVAVLDGADSDSGTCWECGYAKKAGVPVIGLRTDFRGASGDPAGETMNLMLAQSCAKFVNVPRGNRDNHEAVVEEIVRVLRSVIHESRGIRDDRAEGASPRECHRARQ